MQKTLYHNHAQAYGFYKLCKKLLLSLACLYFSIMLFSNAGYAQTFSQDLPEPQGEIILEIFGKISNVTREGKALFDMETLRLLPQNMIHTSTPWGKIKYRFKGVLLSDILEFVGAKKGSKLKFEAWDGYIVSADWQEIISYQPILAFSRNNVPLTRRDRGPLWMIFDRTGFKEVREPVYDNYWVWQLRRIEVK